MRVHFTDLAVSRLKETGEYFDTTTPAFGLRVGKHRKTWFVIRGKKRHKTKMGFYPIAGQSRSRQDKTGRVRSLTASILQRYRQLATGTSTYSKRSIAPRLRK